MKATIQVRIDQAGPQGPQWSYLHSESSSLLCRSTVCVLGLIRFSRAFYILEVWLLLTQISRDWFINPNTSLFTKLFIEWSVQVQEASVDRRADQIWKIAKKPVLNKNVISYDYLEQWTRERWICFILYIMTSRSPSVFFRVFPLGKMLCQVSWINF